MSMPIDLDLTEEQVARTKRAIAGRRALAVASDVVSSVRARVLGSFTGEAGVEVRQERTPLHTGLTDEADSVFVQLVDWSTYWAEQLGNEAPAIRAGWVRDGELIGLPAGITATEAAGQVTRVVRWLLTWDSTIERRDASEEYYPDVARMVWGLQARAGLAERRKPDPAPRPCPVCGEFEVRGEFWGESMTAAELRGDRWMRTREEDFQDAFLAHLDKVTVRCAHCGETDAFEASESAKLRWLR